MRLAVVAAFVLFVPVCCVVAMFRARHNRTGKSRPAAKLPAEGGKLAERIIRVLPFAGPVAWDTRKTPHIAVAGATGRGKTVALRAIVRRAIVSLWQVYIVDPKKFELVGFTGHPGVAAVAHDRAGMEKAIRDVKAELDDRVRRRLDAEYRGENIGFRPLLLVVDEVSELVEITTPERGKSTAVADLGSIMRLGRALDVHVAVGTQQFDVKEALPSSVRRQCDAQIGLGRLGRIGRQMLGWTEDQDRCPIDAPAGRATFVELGKARDVQIDYAEPPRPLNGEPPPKPGPKAPRPPRPVPVVASALPVIVADWSDQ